MFTAIGNLFGAISAGLKLALARFTANNAPAMKAQATSAQDVAQAGQVTTDVQKKDTNAVAQDISV
jgi:hypothetical protein